MCHSLLCELYIYTSFDSRNPQYEAGVYYHSYYFPQFKDEETEARAASIPRQPLEEQSRDSDTTQ